MMEAYLPFLILSDGGTCQNDGGMPAMSHLNGGGGCKNDGGMPAISDWK